MAIQEVSSSEDYRFPNNAHELVGLTGQKSPDGDQGQGGAEHDQHPPSPVPPKAPTQAADS
jgi:hypothetical protein